MLPNRAAKPGKIIAVNDDDGDGDFIPDFADGFAHFPDAGDERVIGEKFVPLVLELPPGTDSTRAMVKFLYEGSNPAAVRRGGQGTPGDPYRYAAAPGELRTWAVPGDMPRSELPFDEGGNYIPPNVALGAMGLGFAAQRAVTFYVEGIMPGVKTGDRRIKVVLDPDGDGPANFVAADAVRFTAVDVDVLIGADDVTDTSLHDDWVGVDRGAGAPLHTIQNFVTVQGPPSFKIDLTMHWSPAAQGSTGTIAIDNIAARSLTTDQSGFASDKFLLRGSNGSSSTEDVRVLAWYAGQDLGSETLTVVKFAPTPETYGKSAIPVNPAYVNSQAPAVGGNLFAADVGDSLDASITDVDTATLQPGAALVPNLGASPKISVDKIEVTWGRHIITNNGVRSLTTSSDDPIGIQVNPPNKGFGTYVAGALVEGNVADNLRVRDNAFPANFDNAAAGSAVYYYLGHPTEKTAFELDIEFNHALRIDAQPVALQTYTIAVHVIDYVDPSTNARSTTGITAGEVQTIIDQVNTVWSQAGVRFVLPVGALFMGQATGRLDFFDVEDDETAAGSSSDDLTSSPGFQTAALDIFFVNSITDPEVLTSDKSQQGATVYPGSGRGLPGCIVAARDATGTTLPKRPAYSLSRSLAHELGHYIMKWSDNAHDGRTAANLMVGGALNTDKKRDLDENQVTRLLSQGVNPTTPDQ
jgi:hypothetical protein